MGDTIIAYLLGVDYQRDYLGRVRHEYPWNFKDVGFYQLPIESKANIFTDVIKPWLDDCGIIGAHRFEQFDFRELDNSIQVLSIDPRSCLDQVAKMFIDKVQSELGYYHAVDQTLDSAIVEKYGIDSELRIKFAQKKIIQWAEHNILPSDNVVGLDEFLQDSSCVDQYKVNK